ncbi:hypothetical protein SAMN05216533_0293 [Streptomyces sp. Ag109_O5-10]|nr:hypothetical protein SAMN05216533_0293 [Streptomyces sp. Ag109_O5-10]
MSDRPGRRVVRVVRRPAVHRRAGADADRPGTHPGTPSWTRGFVRRTQPRTDRPRPAASGTGRGVVAEGSGRSSRAGGGCLAVVASRRQHVCYPGLLPHVRSGGGASIRWCRVGRTRWSLRRRTGRTSWTEVLDAVRLEPGADVAALTTVEVREVVERPVAAGQWRPGDPGVLVVQDAGYDAPRSAHRRRRRSGIGERSLPGCTASVACVSAGKGEPASTKRSSNSPAATSLIGSSGRCAGTGTAGHFIDVRGSCHDPAVRSRCGVGGPSRRDATGGGGACSVVGLFADEESFGPVGLTHGVLVHVEAVGMIPESG